MTRAARFSDIPALVDLVLAAHARSVYVSRTDVDGKLLRQILMQAIQRHGLKSSGGTCVFVGEGANGIDSFIVGTIDRVYHIGVKLMAQSMFLVAKKGGAPRNTSKLINDYIAWAQSKPGVIEINISVTSVISDPARVEKLFIRKGFVRAGTMFERTVK